MTSSSHHLLDLSDEERALREERRARKRKTTETQQLVVKGRSAVDPAAGVERQLDAHVLDEGGDAPPAVYDCPGRPGAFKPLYYFPR